jgi:D-glycero-D-manno-heptose 1,7-bisphosphate phosphatase
MSNKAIFLDKDGTLINDVPYNVDPDLITLTKNSLEGLKLLQDAGYLLVIISNQAGVAYGYFEEAALNCVETKLNELLGDHGIKLSGFYYCPHNTQGKIAAYTENCDCRKPKPGMLLQAAGDLNIDLSSSWMIGDILNDVEAGNRAGCKTILIDNGNETEWILNEYRMPEIKCPDINQAANYLLSQIEHEPKLASL